MEKHHDREKNLLRGKGINMPKILKAVVYELHFPDGKIYVGCTQNLYTRLLGHKSKPSLSVKNHMEKTGYKFSDIKIKEASEILPKHEALKFEKELISKYRKDGVCINTDRAARIRFKVEKMNGETKVLTSYQDNDLCLIDMGNNYEVKK